MVIGTQGRYTRTAIVLHWLILALLVAQYAVGWTMPHIGRNTPVTTLISLHFSIGVLILGLIVVRLVPVARGNQSSCRQACIGTCGRCWGSASWKKGTPSM